MALLYSFHSYRSGLATALHAAGVEDAMIQLICRWMCLESLHVYRRMGTREHERLINLASSMNVDAIQSGNVVRVIAPAPTAPAATLQPLTASPKVGDTLVVPRDLWPIHPCHELGGSGWTVIVTRCHSTAARVRFLAARTRDGRTYEDVLVAFEQLRTAA